MATKTVKLDADGKPVARKKRSAKARRIYLLCEGAMPETIAFARNADDAMDQVDAAQKNGKTLTFKRIELPVPVAKAPATA